MKEEKIIWELDPMAGLISHRCIETLKQYRIDEYLGQTLKKEDFRNGIYCNYYGRSFYGFDKVALIKYVIGFEKNKIATLEKNVARNEALLKEIQE